MNKAWTDYLAHLGATHDDNEIRFAAPADEAERLAAGSVVVPLSHLGLIRADGEDAASFLHNLFSNDVNKLAPGHAQWNSFNSAKGRMLANFLLWPRDGGYLLALSADLTPAMLKKLSMYVLRAKVRLSNAGDDVVLLGLAGSGAASTLAASGLGEAPAPMACSGGPDLQVVALGDAAFVIAVPMAQAEAVHGRLLAAGAGLAGTAAWQAAMVAAGLPLITAATQEEFVAQMLNFELIGGVNFSKGCYPGQEIIARTQYLGNLKKRMYRVHFAADGRPAPGQDLYAPAFGDQSVGKLVNVAATAGGYEALAVMQSASAEAGEVHVGGADGPRLAFLPLPYPLP